MPKNNNKFIEMFTDIDDKYIANAKPVAQESPIKPIVLRPEPRPRTAVWKKLAAAAACLAVLGGGSALAVKMMNAQNGISPSDTSLSSPSASSSLSQNGIEYNGEKYRAANSASFDGVNVTVALEPFAYGRGSVINGVIAIENTTDRIIYLTNSVNATDWVDVSIDGLVDRYRYVRDTAPGNRIEPGDVYYQQFLFDTCEREWKNSEPSTKYKTAQLAVAGTYSGTAVLKLLSDSDDPNSEVIEHTLDFSVYINDWNAADTFSYDIFPYREIDEWLNTDGPEIFTIRDDFPGVRFESDGRSISRIDADGSKIKLFGGVYIYNFMVCDINNDGYGDILATVAFEYSDKFTDDGRLVPCRECVLAYDYANDQLYAIADFENQHFAVMYDEGHARGMAKGALLEAVTPEEHNIIFWKPLTFDMLKPCILKDNGEPLFVDRFKSKYSTGDEFEYEGKSYKIFDHGTAGSGDLPGSITEGYEFIVGVRREIIDGVDTVEFAAFVENIGAEFSIGLLSSTASPDKPILFRFELNDDSMDNHNIFDDYDFKYMPYVLQPGEKYFQTASFPVTEAEYMFSTRFCGANPDKFDETKPFSYYQNGGHTGHRWADFSDKSVSFDDVDQLFGASNLSKALAAADAENN